MTDVLDRYRTKEHTGAMLAFVLDDSDAKALLSAVPAGIDPVSDLHLTLMYLGDTRALSSEVRESARQALESFATRNGPISGAVSGVGRFTNDEGDGTNALYASFDAGELTALRDGLIAAMGAAGVVSPSEHGFTPHITLAYIPSAAPTPDIDVPVLKLTFKAITLAWAGEQEPFYLEGGGATPLTVLKQADGSYRWVGITSNSFEDRDKEVASQAALEADVARADRDKDYGPLLFWHLNGKVKDGERLPLVKLGDCDFNAMHGRMLIESGLCASAEVGERLEATKDDYEFSLGFDFSQQALAADGTFAALRRTERSLVPRGRASNPLTGLPIVYKEQQMLKEKLEQLKQFFKGDEGKVQAVLSWAETGEKEALAAGLRTKAKKEDGEEELPPDAKPNGESPAADAPFTQAAATDEEEPEEGAEKKVGQKEYDAIHAALAQIVANQDAMQQAITALTTGGAEKAAREADTAQRLKEATDALAVIVPQLDAVKEGVAELKGELPRKLGDPLAVYRPSQHGAEPPAERVKAVTPEHDPWAKHLTNFIPGYTPTAPGA